jgi:hypothetical protein
MHDDVNVIALTNAVRYPHLDRLPQRARECASHAADVVLQRRAEPLMRTRVLHHRRRVLRRGRNRLTFEDRR